MRRFCFAHKINNACNASVKVAKDNTKEVSTKYQVLAVVPLLKYLTRFYYFAEFQV